MESLAKDEKPEILEAVARKISTPEAALRRLASSPIDGVRAAASENEMLPLDLMEALRYDPSPKVRGSIGFNLAAPVDLLDELALDPDPIVRWLLAQNPSARDATLVRLASDTNPSRNKDREHGHLTGPRRGRVLSLVLRHKHAAAGVELDRSGWCGVTE